MKKTKLNKLRKAAALIATAFFILTVTVIPAFAADDPVTGVLTNANNLMLAAVRLVGIAVDIVGIVKLAPSLSHHDGAQIIQGVSILAAGLMITFVKEILIVIGVTI